MLNLRCGWHEDERPCATLHVCGLLMRTEAEIPRACVETYGESVSGWRLPACLWEDGEEGGGEWGG